MLAQAARQQGGFLKGLWGLEETPSSVEDARTNARELMFNEAQFICGRAEDELQDLVTQLGTVRHHDRSTSPGETGTDTPGK